MEGGVDTHPRPHRPYRPPHPREHSKQAVAQGPGVGRQGCEVDFPQTLPPFPHVFIKSSPRAETTICSPSGACEHSGGRSQLSYGSPLPSGPALGSAPTGPASARPRPRRLDPSPRARPSGSRSGLSPAPACPAVSRRHLGGFGVSFLLDFPFGLSKATYRLPFTSVKFNKRWSV